MLVKALPDDSAFARGNDWSVATELQVVTIERMEKWFSALLQAAMRQEKIMVPGELKILRPSEAQKQREEESKPRPKRRVDPNRMREIANKLGMAVG